MSEHLCDLGHRRAVADHPGREAMSEQMGDAASVGTDAGALESESDDVVDRARTRQAFAARKN